MDPLETFMLVGAIFLIFAIWAGTGSLGTHRLYYRGNPWPGLVRLSIVGGMLWVGLVLLVWADESVRGVYVLFYLCLGYVAIKLFGQVGGKLFGLRYRVDVVERRNGAIARVLAAFTLATGMIFGGSLWGDADPLGDDEGGWWIVWAFFLLGWLTLVVAFGIYLARENRRRPGPQLPRRSSAEPQRTPFIDDVDDPRPAALFLLASGVALTDAVSGDFWGWRHGLLTFGVLAGLLLVHEVFASILARREGGDPSVRDGTVEPAAPAAAPAVSGRLRLIEGGLYLALALGALGLNRWFDLILATE